MGTGALQSDPRCTHASPRTNWLPQPLAHLHSALSSQRGEHCMWHSAKHGAKQTSPSLLCCRCAAGGAPLTADDMLRRYVAFRDSSGTWATRCWKRLTMSSPFIARAPSARVWPSLMPFARLKARSCLLALCRRALFAWASACCCFRRGRLLSSSRCKGMSSHQRANASLADPSAAAAANAANAEVLSHRSSRTPVSQPRRGRSRGDGGRSRRGWRHTNLLLV